MTGSSYLIQRAGARVQLKLELFQKTGSFKVRGVLNTLRQLGADELAHGVVSLSAGNHAQARAWGASQCGTRATIVMPATAVASKEPTGSDVRSGCRSTVQSHQHALAADVRRHGGHHGGSRCRR